MKYIALTEGVRGTRTLLPANINILEKVKQSRTKDIYFSLFQYDKDHYAQYQEKKSLAGMTGVKTDKLFFDFDDANNTENARQDAVELFARLIESGVPSDQIGAYFSGGKGFHIEVLLNQDLNNTEFKNIVFNLAGDLATFDVRVSDEQRIIRAPLAKHDKTGLFKIPLTQDQLIETPIDIIKNIAQDANNSELGLLSSWKKINLPEPLEELKTINYKTKLAQLHTLDVEDTANLKFDINQLDLRKCPKWLSPERFALQEGFFLGSSNAGSGGGERNDAFMILAATYKNQGINKKIALNMLSATAELQAARTGEEIYADDKISREVIDVVYSLDWTGGIYSSDHPLLLKTRKRFGILDPMEKLEYGPKTINSITSKFKYFVKNIENNTVKTGIKTIDDNLFLTTGTNVAILGAPGSGKSSLALEILKNTSKAGIKSVFASLDMSSTRMYEKILYKVSGQHREDIYEAFKNNEEDDFIKKIEENFGNVYFYDRSQPTVQDLRKYILKCEEQSGEKIKLVVLDYFERIFSDITDDTASSKKIAGELQDLVNDLDICLITLVQPNKMSGDMSKPIASYTNIKGSSFLAQSFRIILSIYREGFNPQDTSTDNFLTVNVLKNDLGEPGSYDFEWIGKRGEIREMDPYVKRKLLDLRENGRNEDDI
jgi:hypothetical protein